MLFNSFDFVVFFCVVYGAYVILSHRCQNYLLLVASYFFYGCWDWRFLSLLLGSTALDFWIGRWLGRTEDPRYRKRIVTLSIASNLGILGTFKYFGFFAESAVSVLRALGVEAHLPTVAIVLPVGISFYTFQSLSYTIDVYRGEVRPVKSFVDFALYVSFFPHMVAGPIQRATNLLLQVQRERHMTCALIREGSWLILLGYFKKVVIADNMIVFTQPLLLGPDGYSSLEVLVAIYAFAFRIYGDFSGYSDIARGLAKLMGFELMLNFRFPYFATNPRDFWSRWHISFSTWLRDYLYIPLGGNRRGTLITYRNLLLTMLLGGLWHGAAWHFVSWGAFHGTLLILHRMLEKPMRRIEPKGQFAKLAWHVMTVIAFFHVTCAGWLLFAVPDLALVPALLERLFSHLAFEGDAILLAFMALPILLLSVEGATEYRHQTVPVSSWPPRTKVLAYTFTFFLIVMCGETSRHEFIYFQF